MQKRDRKSLLLNRRLNSLERGLLLRAEDKVQVRRTALFETAHAELGGLFCQLHHAALDQGLQGGTRNWEIANLVDGCPAILLLEKHNDLLLVLVHLSAGLFKDGNLNSSTGIAGGGCSLAGNPLLTRQVIEDAAVRSSSGTNCALQRLLRHGQGIPRCFLQHLGIDSLPRTPRGAGGSRGVKGFVSGLSDPIDPGFLDLRRQRQDGAKYIANGS